MIPFSRALAPRQQPSPAAGLVLLHTARELAAIFAPTETRCSWQRWSSISALRQSLRWRSLPNGALRRRFAPRNSAPSAPLPSFPAARCCPRDGLEWASRRALNRADPALVLPRERSAFAVAR